VIGPNATYAGYAVLALALVGWQALAVTRRSLTLGRLAAWASSRFVGRMALALGWAWLGWHLFARGSAAFLH